MKVGKAIHPPCMLYLKMINRLQTLLRTLYLFKLFYGDFLIVEWRVFQNVQQLTCIQTLLQLPSCNAISLMVN